ncbi:MAG: O-antigen ligase family protein [Coriobacteriia bacterium]|nr:O-antigen ligase family protein [Coriobacteriia bacterium]MBN2839969.1 O-antigen ligase family protein [Coriobacteriia bacterium]
MGKKRKQQGGTQGSPRTGKPQVAAASAAAGMDLWDRTAWICLHALVVLVPLAMANLGPLSPGGLPLTYDQFDIVKVFLQRGLMLVAFGSWALGILLRGGKIRTTRIGWVVLAFLVWLVVTTVASVHVPTAVFGKYRRFEGLISFVTYAAVMFTALQLADRASRIRSLERSLAIGGVIVSLYGALQVIGTVPLGLARVLQPASVLLAIGAPIGLIALALTKLQGDRQAQVAAYIGAGVAAVVGVFLAAGLAQNIEVAVQAGSSVVALDPVRWGNLPFETNRAFSTFGNPDLLGGYLIFPWAITIGLALSEEHRTWRVLYWVFTLVNAFTGVTSYVRGAWIGATVALVLIVIAFVRLNKGTGTRLARIDQAFIGGGALTVAAIAVGSSLRPDAVRNVLTRVVSIFQFDQGSALTRFQIWEAALAAIAERPIFGWGADTFRLLFPMFKPAAYVAVAGYLSVADNVHNYPLQLTSGIGIPGALLMYGLIAVVLVTSARTVFARGAGMSRMLMAAVWAGVVGYVVHLMFGLSVTGSTVLLWLSMGLLVSLSASERRIEAPDFGFVVSVLVVGVVLIGLVLNMRFVMADNTYLRGRLVEQGIERVNTIERAIELNPYNDMYRLERGVAWQDLFRGTGQAYVRSVEAGTPDEQAREAAGIALQNAIDAYDGMIDFVPEEYDTYVFYASLYNEAGAYLDPSYFTKAIEIGLRGVEVEPFGPAIRVQLASAALSIGQVDLAIEHLEVATELDPNFVQAFNTLGDAYRVAGRADDARAAYEYVLQRSPGDAIAVAGLVALESTATTAP